MRLSIELSSEQHQRLKAAAASQGKSIKDYVLERTLAAGDQQKTPSAQEIFLAGRAEEASKNDGLSDKAVNDIFDEVRNEKRDSG